MTIEGTLGLRQGDDACLFAIATLDGKDVGKTAVGRAYAGICVLWELFALSVDFHTGATLNLPTEPPTGHVTSVKSMDGEDHGSVWSALVALLNLQFA